MSAEKRICVYFERPDVPEEENFMGTLFVHTIRGKELFSFEFDKTWLKNHPKQKIDPELQFYAGPQWTQKANLGLFSDSAPDRWGRKLMQRRELVLARKFNRAPKMLLESDFLLGVNDETRMGALRFKLEKSGVFLNDEQAMAVPPWVRLRELEEASRHFENDAEALSEKWISMLIAPGSSLGGARPKSSVLAPDETLWIAKFPSHNDENDTSAWECATMLMARDAGLTVPEFRLEKFSKFGSTFLVKRFDRQGKNRIHFASAMTLLCKSDGDDASAGASYLEIAEFIMKYGASPNEDLLELWKRIAFSIVVSNTDDHLRNHGFLLMDDGWRLSPVYDLNPNPRGNGLSLNINEYNNSQDFDLLKEVAPFFHIEKPVADAVLLKIFEVCSRWQDYAKRLKIGRQSQELMASAFFKTRGNAKH